VFRYGLVVARWWVLPAPLVVYLIVDAVAPVPADDDISGVGRLILLVACTVALAVGIFAGRLARQSGDSRPQSRDDETP
jgi:hypothetical protein